jgi:hypothetical protein
MNRSFIPSAAAGKHVKKMDYLNKQPLVLLAYSCFGDSLVYIVYLLCFCISISWAFLAGLFLILFLHLLGGAVLDLRLV